MRSAVLLFFSFLLSAHAYSQPINLTFEHTPLGTALRAIQEQGHCPLSFTGGEVRGFFVTRKIVNANPEEATKQCLEGLPLQYRINARSHGYSITVLRKPAARSIEHEKTYAQTLAAITVLPTFDGYRGFHTGVAPPGSWGSWHKVGAPVLTRRPSIDIIDDLDGQASGVLAGPGTDNPLNISIRGTSTLHADKQPLFVVDGFPFPGDLRDINRADIESVVILKDAAATSLWGARAGNGVVVITTKRGIGKGLRMTFNAGTTVTQKPNLSYIPLISPADGIALETKFFNAHFYDAVLYGQSALPPVVETLSRVQSKQLSLSESDALIKGYAQHNLLKDLGRWFYQSAVRQQYHFALSSGNATEQHYLSAGYDYDPTSLRRNGFQRWTLQGSSNQSFLSGRLQLSTLVHYSDMTTKDNNTGAVPVNYPYAALAGENGEPLPVNYKYSSSWLNSFSGTPLLDWTYKPLQELVLADNKTRITDYYAQTTVQGYILPGLVAEGTYRLYRGSQTISNRYGTESFYYRDLANLFAQPGASSFTSAIPSGDILDRSITTTTAHYLRGQLSYSYTPLKGNVRQWSIHAGAENSEQVVHNETQRIYGFNPSDGAAGVQVSSTEELMDITGLSRKMPMNQGYQDVTTRFLSFFANADMKWKDRLNLYAAAKKDGTNIVGVRTRSKWAPFWAVGLGYDAGRKSAGDSTDLPNIWKARVSYGSNGNVGNRSGNLVTQLLGNNNYGQPQRGIVNPPDPSLSWEKNFMLNAGVDYGLLRDGVSPQGRLQGSLDVYHRWGNDLLGYDTLPPSTGMTSFFGNSAAMKGWGIDLVLNTGNTRGDVRWLTTLLLSYEQDKVTRYAITPSSAAGYVTGNIPRTGSPLTAIYSYRSASLDPANGDPRGYLGREVSKDYNAIVNAKGDTGIVNSGRYQPALFGGLTNTFSSGRWTLSTVVTFKGLYIFRRSSMNYYGMITGQEPGNRDYRNSWKMPGDEKRTRVPSPPDATNDPYRSTFYAYSDATITRGDVLRWHDLRLSYDLFRENPGKTSVRQATFYIDVTQLGILWRANRNNIDPEATGYGDLPKPRTYTLGMRLQF